MHPLDMINEWRHGCSNSYKKDPSSCQECTMLLIDEVEEKLKQGIQTRKKSFEEAVVSTLIGFMVSFGLQKLLNYAYSVEMSNSTAAWFVFWFTILSVLRSYVLRRIYNSEFWRGRRYDD